MCILFVYVNPKPAKGQYRLVLATNRDEYYQRPAKQAHRWPEADHVIGGKDLETGREGGTWFGISVRQHQLRAGALLNVTGEPRQQSGVVTGRGCIVTDYLRGELSAKDYVTTALRTGTRRTFNAYTFVTIELGLTSDIVQCYTNVTDKLISYGGGSSSSSNDDDDDDDDDTTVWYSCGNSLHDEPLVKVCAGAQRFNANVTRLNTVTQRDTLISELMSLLKWNVHHLPDAVLERRVPNAEIRQQLSSVYVHIPAAGYGTRTHTLLLVDDTGRVEFIEDTMDCPPHNVDRPNWSTCQHLAHL